MSQKYNLILHNVSDDVVNSILRFASKEHKGAEWTVECIIDDDCFDKMVELRKEKGLD